MSSSFRGLSVSCLVAGAVAAVGALMAAALLPAHPPRPELEPIPASSPSRAAVALD